MLPRNASVHTPCLGCTVCNIRIFVAPNVNFHGPTYEFIGGSTSEFFGWCYEIFVVKTYSSKNKFSVNKHNKRGILFR